MTLSDAERASSFGRIAAHYDRYRPPPPAVAVEWIVPAGARTAIDLGAGTGALSRLLCDRVDEVVAVEPDARMREFLAAHVPGARVVEGRGESIPVDDASADVVVASCSWHWMDPEPTLAEVARVLRPGGVLGALWSGTDPDGDFMVRARAFLDAERAGAGADVLEGPDPQRPMALETAGHAAFTPVERREFTWTVPMTRDQLLGMLGTMSWVILMDDGARADLLDRASDLLASGLGLSGEAMADVEFACATFRTTRRDT